ncbi:uncharacterized protein G2W53_002048 [Senna tora]|uniref:Uncharacterized protein n=1 Tax=Senna tora TaxID=362788 RepID=A0A834XL00_9FABA|nr:uncharacterized protein G2W53_002048 [Senna tora]
MERHEKRFGETDGRALCWRYALSTAANLPHFHFSDSQSR